VSSPNQNKDIVHSIVFSPTLSLWGTTCWPTFAWPHSFRFLSVRTPKTLVYSSQIWNEETLYQGILMPMKSCPAALDLWKGATVHDQTCPCVHYLRCWVVWGFVLNCDLRNNKDSTAIKLGTCTLYILFQCKESIYCWVYFCSSLKHSGHVFIWSPPPPLFFFFYLFTFSHFFNEFLIYLFYLKF